MKELKRLIAEHTSAWKAAKGTSDLALWDREKTTSTAVDTKASQIGVRLVGYVDPKIELIVLS
jgi:hypothetical protein